MLFQSFNFSLFWITYWLELISPELTWAGSTEVQVHLFILFGICIQNTSGNSCTNVKIWMLDDEKCSTTIFLFFVCWTSQHSSHWAKIYSYSRGKGVRGKERKVCWTVYILLYIDQKGTTFILQFEHTLHYSHRVFSCSCHTFMCEQCNEIMLGEKEKGRCVWQIFWYMVENMGKEQQLTHWPPNHSFFSDAVCVYKMPAFTLLQLSIWGNKNTHTHNWNSILWCLLGKWHETEFWV